MKFDNCFVLKCPRVFWTHWVVSFANAIRYDPQLAVGGLSLPFLRKKRHLQHPTSLLDSLGVSFRQRNFLRPPTASWGLNTIFPSTKPPPITPNESFGLIGQFILSTLLAMTPKLAVGGLFLPFLCQNHHLRRPTSLLDSLGFFFCQRNSLRPPTANWGSNTSFSFTKTTS
jgi:hypothetical protein